ncbi:MAG: hypothetical protein ACPG6B_06975 [Oceanihabitans sp.]
MKKDLITGLVIGLITNCIGFIIALKVLGNGDGFLQIIETANAQGFLGKLISLGAILNLLAFFYFLRKRQDTKAKGVLIVTVLVAVLTLVFKII